ncbi:MAG: YwaF family protein [Clostridia bacterium]|nr:YwaF family protein [Clostridia bacterium]
MTEFLHFLEGEMQRPGNYGWFHLTALALVILTTVLLCLFAKKVKDKTFRLIVFLFWIVLILFETYKQVIFSFNYNDANPTWDYQWYAFPFQMCSSPIYVLPFIFLTKEGSVLRRATVAYSATYVLFAGAAVMFYPNDVFVRTIGINIQTMVWHGSQVILGVYFLSRYAEKLNFRFFLGGVIVFVCMSATAIALDLIVPRFIGDETFNMFYISPLFPSTLPVLSIIYPLVPWALFFVLYLIGFTLAAYLMYLIPIGIRKLTVKKEAAA